MCSLTFSADGKIIASAHYTVEDSDGADEIILIWDVENTLLKAVVGDTSSGDHLVFSPNCEHLASTTREITQIWEMSTVLNSGIERGAHAGPSLDIQDVAISPDGKHILAVTSDENLRLWDADTGALEHCVKNLIFPTVAIDFSPDSFFFVTSDKNGSVYLWVTETASCVKSFCVEPNTMFGYRLAFNNWDDQLRPLVAIGVTDFVEGIEASNDGPRLMDASSACHVLQEWDIAAGELISRTPGPGMPMHTLVYSPDSRYIAVADGNASLWIWDFELNRRKARLELPGLASMVLAFSNDSQRILATHGHKEDARVVVFDISGQVEDGLEHSSPLTIASFELAGKFPMPMKNFGIGQHARAYILHPSSIPGLDVSQFKQAAAPSSINYCFSSDDLWIIDADGRKIVRKHYGCIYAAWNHKLVFTGVGGKIIVIHV